MGSKGVNWLISNSISRSKLIFVSFGKLFVWRYRGSSACAWRLKYMKRPTCETENLAKLCSMALPSRAAFKIIIRILEAFYSCTDDYMQCVKETQTSWLRRSLLLPSVTWETQLVSQYQSVLTGGVWPCYCVTHNPHPLSLHHQSVLRLTSKKQSARESEEGHRTVSVMSLRVSRDFYQIQSLLRSLKDSIRHSDMIAGDSIVMATVGLSPLQNPNIYGRFHGQCRVQTNTDTVLWGKQTYTHTHSSSSICVYVATSLTSKVNEGTNRRTILHTYTHRGEWEREIHTHWVKE